MDPLTDIAPPAVPATLIAEEIFPGAGEMAARLRATDWARTPLGPLERWSPSLRMMISILLVNRFPLLLWWGPRFCQIYNDAYRPVLGVKHPQSIGQPASECWPEIWAVIGPLIETPFRGGPATWMDDIALEVNRHGFVEETHFTIAYSPVPDATAPNGIGGVLATVHEISAKVVGDRRVMALRDLGARSTEAKTAEEACQIAAATLSQHPKDLPFALLYLLDADQHSATLAASAGIAPGDAISPTVIAFGDDHSDGAVWPLAEAVRTETVQVVDNLAARFAVVPPGPWADPPHTAVVVPIHSNIAHQLVGVLVAGISSRLRFDDDYLGFLELVSNQIATVIANAREYEHERRRAEELAAIDRAKTIFFSNVSHEFRTPLTLLLGPLADLLADDAALPGDTRAQLAMMQRNGLRLTKLVNTLLDFSRIEAGRTQANFVPTDLASLTADLASAFRSLIERAGLRFTVDCAPLPAPVAVDREMWEKIVLNLLSNAFKFTLTGEIAVRLHATDAAAILTVRDTGVGIPPDELPRIFERMHRVQETRARSYEGTGIGLALAQELVHLHGGTITAESAVDGGTTFTVTLPLGTAHLPLSPGGTEPLASTALGAAPFVQEAARWLPDEPARVERTPPPEARQEQDAERPARILLVDDNADMRAYLRRLLGEHYQVEAVANGAEAIARMREQPADLVLADVMMPELDGFGLLQALRDDPRTQAIPVILLSARAGEEATVEGLAAGADDYLVKPFTAREVLAHVAAHLESARKRAAAMARAHTLQAVFEAAADGIVIYDRQGRLVEWNAALATLFEFDQMPNYAGMAVYERPAHLQVRDAQDRPIPAEALPFMRAARGEVLTGTHAVDLTVTTPSGRMKQVNVSAAPLRDETGASIGAVAVYRDVTERRALEREARANAAKLHSILDLLPVGVAFVDATGKAVLVNQAVRDIWGGHISMAESRNDFGSYRAWWPETGEPVAAEEWGLARALATGEVALAKEISIETFDGTRKTILSSDAPLRDDAGAIIGAMSVIIDITAHKQLEQHTHHVLAALLAMAETLAGGADAEDTPAATAIEDEVDAIAETDPPALDATQRLVRKVLALAQQVLDGRAVVAWIFHSEQDGMRPLAVVGRTPEIERQWWRNLGPMRPSDYLPPEILERISAGEAITLDLAKEPPISGQDDFGVTNTLLVSARLDAGRLLVLGVEARDQEPFTPQERDLAHAAARLAALVVERDRLLREREEAQAQQMALEEANRRMNEFLSIASHELRTPLTSISANLQMAERRLHTLTQADLSPLPPGLADLIKRAATLVERTNRQTSHLDRLVGDLLDTSRIQEGRLELRLEPCDLAAIVQEEVQQQQAAWPERMITLHLPRRTPLMLLADADRIGQVITNFLTNALKYSPEDQPVAVQVRTHGATVRVEVRDHGPGIAAEYHARLWERFFRVPGINHQSGSGLGLGLGLHICQTIIERHHGTVGVTSAPGKGSAFWFTLPLAQA